MNVTPREALAGLRLLAFVARADDRFDDEERRVLRMAIEGIDPKLLPEGTRPESLVEDAIDLDAELAVLAESPRKGEMYRAAYSIACADGEAASAERAVLAQAREALGITVDVDDQLERLFAPASAAEARKTGFERIDDVGMRAAAVRKRTLECSALAAVLGAFPVPGLSIATDLAVVALQLSLVRDVAAMWGRDVAPERARALLAGLGLGTGARIAVGSLAKLLPGWGSAVGAVAAFASTFAVGGVLQSHYERASVSRTLGPALPDARDVAEAFAAERDRAHASYETYEGAVAEARTKPSLVALERDLASGRVTRSELESRLGGV